jgi:hypothetical protein
MCNVLLLVQHYRSSLILCGDCAPGLLVLFDSVAVFGQNKIRKYLIQVEILCTNAMFLTILLWSLNVYLDPLVPGLKLSFGLNFSLGLMSIEATVQKAGTPLISTSCCRSSGLLAHVAPTDFRPCSGLPCCLRPPPLQYCLLAAQPHRPPLSSWRCLQPARLRA